MALIPVADDVLATIVNAVAALVFIVVAPDQIDWLKAVLDKESSGEDIGKLVGAWGRGDADGLAKEMKGEEQDSDALRKLLLTDRLISATVPLSSEGADHIQTEEQRD